jgi:hypothetical protein
MPRGLMSYWKSFGLAIFAVFCLLAETTGSAHAQCNPCATEWSGGQVINLGGLPGSFTSQASRINDAGQVVGDSYLRRVVIPETSTWAMMLLGFAGLGYAGYRARRSAPGA